MVSSDRGISEWRSQKEPSPTRDVTRRVDGDGKQYVMITIYLSIPMEVFIILTFYICDDYYYGYNESLTCVYGTLEEAHAAVNKIACDSRSPYSSGLLCRPSEYAWSSSATLRIPHPSTERRRRL